MKKIILICGVIFCIGLAIIGFGVERVTTVTSETLKSNIQEIHEITFNENVLFEQ